MRWVLVGTWTMLVICLKMSQCLNDPERLFSLFLDKTRILRYHGKPRGKQGFVAKRLKLTVACLFQPGKPGEPL